MILPEAPSNPFCCLRQATHPFAFSRLWGFGDKSWGEWLAALSGGIYIPFEVGHLIREPGWISVLVLGINLALVIYLALVLFEKRQKMRGKI